MYNISVRKKGVNDLDNFNRIMINMIHNQINSIVEERRGLERNKNWRKIPTEVKEKYYEGYNVLINALYESLANRFFINGLDTLTFSI